MHVSVLVMKKVRQVWHNGRQKNHQDKQLDFEAKTTYRGITCALSLSTSSTRILFDSCLSSSKFKELQLEDIGSRGCTESFL
jgi:hypothetical protein